MAHTLHGLIAPAILLGALFSGPAYAQPGAPVATTGEGSWNGSWQGGVWQGQWTPAAGAAAAGSAYGYIPAPTGAYPAETNVEEAALAERCRSEARPNSGIGGAVIGGVAGAVIGNRVASGNRALGTVAGAAVGAVAGSAISKAASRAREISRERDCAAYWARSAPQIGYLPPSSSYQPAPNVAYAAPAYGYSYAPMGYAPMGYVLVPAGAPQAAPQAAQQTTGPCTETRTVSYEYVDAPVRRRVAAPRPVNRDKRIRE